MSTIKTGMIGQEYAERFLKKKGYRLIQRNWAVPLGEVDLIFWAGDALAFIEVKTEIRESPKKNFSPEDHFNPAKKKRLIRLAALYITYKRFPDISYQIDLVAVDVDAHSNLSEIRHYPNVVEEYRM